MQSKTGARGERSRHDTEALIAEGVAAHFEADECRYLWVKVVVMCGEGALGVCSPHFPSKVGCASWGELHCSEIVRGEVNLDIVGEGLARTDARCEPREQVGVEAHIDRGARGRV
eukprot:scaffold80166_cov31-Tisochrysis_lutea.AAC.2